MTTAPDPVSPARASRDLARRVVAILQNRTELFCLEVREERERVERAVFFVSGAAIAFLLGGGSAILLVAVLFEGTARLWALGILTAALFTAGGLFLAAIHRLRRNWKTLEETRNQLRLDREQLLDLLQ